ncbi:MAG: hypothetical protein IKU34_01120 [Clostridia bacterium]|nr:hypothetical protein [Clostridia bacterium]
MYSFQANTGKRKSKRLIRLLLVVIFILVIALSAVSYVYFRSRGQSDVTGEALMARAVSEAGNAQSAVYRLTQSSGTNTMTLLSTVRSHIYALQCINTLASNIYGPGTIIADMQLLSDCINIITDCEAKMQAGGVLTGSFATLRDNIDLLVASYNPAVQ